MCAGDSGSAPVTVTARRRRSTRRARSSTSIHLEPVDAVHITTLVDNVSDMLLVNEGPAHRVGLASPPDNAPTMPAAFIEGGASSTRCAQSMDSRRSSPS